MDTNNMAFDPTKYGAIPVQTNSFNPSQYGATPVQQAQPAAPKSLSDSIWDGLAGVGNAVNSVLPGKQIGESLVKAGTNVANLATGGVSKFNAGLPENTVDVPKLAGDYVNAGLTVAAPVLGGSTLAGRIGVNAAAGAAGGVANGILQGKSFGETGKDALEQGAIQGGLGVLAGSGGIAKNVVKSATEHAAEREVAKGIDMVGPKLNAKETASALASRGGTKSGILGSIKANTDPSVERIFNAIKENVPDFNPKKSLVENINATKTAVGTLADDLKSRVVASGEDRIYPLKELASRLKGLEKSPQLVGDVEKTYGKVVNKALEIARDNGGKVSDLFQARKEFDDYISKSFPDLYSSERLTPMRSAIKDIRNAMTDFTADHLPEDVGLRDSLTTQHRLLQAVENMSEKAASGSTKEIGTNVINRTSAYLKRHPVLAGVAGAAGYNKLKETPVVGSILP